MTVMYQHNDKLTVTLEAQAWETVMRVLSEAPYRIVAPLISEIQGQCMRQQTPNGHDRPQRVPGVANGPETEATHDH